MPVADVKARHDDGGIPQLLRDIFGADEDLNGAVRIEPGGQVGERVFIQCAEHLLRLGQVLIFRLAQQTVLPGKVNFRAMSLLEHMRRKIDDDGHEARCGACAARHAVHDLWREAGGGKPGEARIEHGGQELEVLLRHMQRQLDEAVLDVFIGRHDHENEAPGVREDDLEMADSHFPGRSRHGIGREVRQLGDELADLAHGLVQLLHTRFHGLIDALRLVDGEAVILHQTVDVEAVARGARDAPGRRVRLLQKAERRQLGHFVADGRRGEVHIRQRGDRLGATGSALRM